MQLAQGLCGATKGGQASRVRHLPKRANAKCLSKPVVGKEKLGGLATIASLVLLLLLQVGITRTHARQLIPCRRLFATLRSQIGSKGSTRDCWLDKLAPKLARLAIRYSIRYTTYFRKAKGTHQSASHTVDSPS